MKEEPKYPACPIPISEYPRILLAHGGGGRLMHRLIDKIFIAAFGQQNPETRHDGALLDIKLPGRAVLTTDSYVVHPLFFPGGDIGKLAIDGTVNDLAMCGAKPLFLSAGFIIEEGFEIDSLWRIALSMCREAEQSGVRIVTGDTKVVERGKGHGLFINTAGVGILEHDLIINPSSIRPGDVILINGDIGRHGIAIMSSRESLAFETEIESDCAPLADTVRAMLNANLELHCLRDLTRGGLGSALVEIAESAQGHIQIEEDKIPVSEPVRGACEMLGYEPLYIANEGRFVAFIPGKDASKALELLKNRCGWTQAGIIGRVIDRNRSLVTMKSQIGAERIIDMLNGEQLPRIC
ncbi:MAG: hydrogenase expression/formation protein HypE [Candidatus Zixiibacteriota bacterium]